MRRLFQIIHHRWSSSSGVSLIELMVSLVIFSIGILAIVAMTIMSIKGSSLVNRMTEANMLAQAKMEQLLLQDVTTISSSFDTLGNYTRTWLVEPNSTVPGDNSQWITVTVDWVDNMGDHQMRFKSYSREL